jgi:O-antigen/teichoic acid export membrane protein
MNTIQRIAKNTGILFASQVVRHLISFLYVIFIARHLGPLDFGILTFALAFTSIFGIVCDFGLQTLTTREVARDKTSALKYIINISWMKVILCTAAFGMIALTINLFGYPGRTVTVVYLLGLATAFSAFNTMFYSIFQAYEQMEYQSFGQILHSVSMFGGVVLAIKCNFSVTGFAALYLLASIVILAYNFAILRMKFSNLLSTWYKKATNVDWSFWKSTIKEALPFGLAITFMTIFYWIDSVMLSLMKGDIVVGWYNAAYRMVLALLFIPNSFIAAIYPVMSKFYKTSEDSLRLSFEKSFKYLTMLGLPIGVGTTLLAKRFVLLIFGTEYMNSILPLQILVWSSVFIFMSQPLGNLLNSINKQIIITKVTGVCVAVNVILNLILIPKYSLIGASIATVLTQLIGSLLIIIWASKAGYSVFKKKFACIMIIFLISSALMGIFIIYFQDLILLELVVLATVLYFTTLYVIGGISNDDYDLILKVVQRR